MAQICILNSSQLAELLKEAVSWSDSVSSLMVSATNGAILSYAFRGPVPSIKDLRSLSTTATAAYTVASESTLVFEAQVSRAISVITPLAQHVLLAVTGPERKSEEEEQDTAHSSAVNGDLNGTRKHAPNQVLRYQHEDEHSKEAQQMRADLESISEELAATLKEELSSMKWPDDF